MNKFLDKFFKFFMVNHEVRNFWKLRKKYFATNNIFLQKYYLYQARKIMHKSSAHVPFSQNIPRFTSPHGFNGIMISRGAKIGKRCVIFHQVTLGTNTLRDAKCYGAPTIGNNVYIGTGAKLIGGIKIGNNVRIGANCVVTCDVPSNSTVVLPHPRIIIKKEAQPNKWFVLEDKNYKKP